MNTIYRIYVEGRLIDETSSRRVANSLRRKYENEGWNIRVIKFEQTVVGEIGVDV